MKLKTIFFIVLVVLIGWFFTSKTKISDQNKDVAKTEISKNETPATADPKISESEQTALNQKNEAVSVDQTAGNSDNFEKKESVEERFKKQGYVQDPNNENQLMKKIIGKDGKEKTEYVDKYDEGFEPTRKTIKNALEILETKGELNPADEISILRPFDLNLQENIMLSGHFRDDENDLEMSFSPITDENGNSLGQDRVCFISPKLKINIPKNNKSILRTDETGYAVVKLNDTLYARFTWSYEFKKKRTLHGVILIFKNGAFVKTNTFAAQEVHTSKGETLKYCE